MAKTGRPNPLIVSAARRGDHPGGASANRYGRCRRERRMETWSSSYRHRSAPDRRGFVGLRGAAADRPAGSRVAELTPAPWRVESGTSCSPPEGPDEPTDLDAVTHSCSCPRPRLPAGPPSTSRRRGAENPMQEVAKSVLYGALAGVVVGGRSPWSTTVATTGDFIRWGSLRRHGSRPRGRHLVHHHPAERCGAARVPRRDAPARGDRAHDRSRPRRPHQPDQRPLLVSRLRPRALAGAPLPCARRSALGGTPRSR